MNNYFILFLSLIICLCRGFYNVERISDKGAVVIIANASKYPIAIQTDENYENLSDFQRISYQKIDTIHIPINDYQFVYFSHKNTFGDTVLLSQGDTLRLVASDEHIKSSLSTMNAHTSSLNSRIALYYNSKQRVEKQKVIDVLTKLFYEVNYKGKPLSGANDFRKFENYPVKVNRSAFLERSSELEQLLLLLRKQYDVDVDSIKKEAHNYPNKLYLTFFYKTNIDYYNKLKFLYLLSRNQKVLMSLNDKIFINKGLLENPYAKQILTNYLESTVIKKKADFSKSKLYLDYKEAYIDAHNYLPVELIKYVKFICIENMVEYGESFLEIGKKFADFKREYHDQRLNFILENKYLFNLDKFENVQQDLKLIDVNRNIVSLNDILNNAKGKLVYIDFWASWCAPCRAAMPAANQLIGDFSQKDVIYIYLSIDKDAAAWKVANSAEKLENYKYSFKLINQDQADFVKKIDLKEIPRYLLFDKYGKLVHQNAPGPEGPEIRTLIKKYLIE